MSEVRLSVIIPSTLRPAQLPLLRRAIQSVLTQTAAVKTEIWVVSTQPPPASLRRRWPQLRFVTAPATAGFGELNNTAVAAMRAESHQPDWILLLNDDAWLAPDFLAAWQQLDQLRTVDAYAPLILTADRPAEIDSYGVEYFRSGYAKNNQDESQSTTLVTAGCLLLRWSIIQRVIAQYGFFFNPIYYYYLEDVDLSIRMLMLGAVLERTRQLVANHHGSHSSGGRRSRFALYQTYRNVWWVLLCCWPLRQLLRQLPNILLVQLWLIWYGSCHAGPLTYPRVLWQTVLHWPRLWRYRRQTLQGYQRGNRFSQIWTDAAFRTYHRRRIPAL